MPLNLHAGTGQLPWYGSCGQCAARRAFQQMRNTFLNTVVAVIRDVRWFMLLLLVRGPLLRAGQHIVGHCATDMWL